MIRALYFIIASMSLLIASAAFAQTSMCPASNAVGQNGIGDGCSIPTYAYTFPEVGIFEGTFTPACINHDKCYSTLGTTYSECNNKFISDMRSACSSSYNPVLLPSVYATCVTTAQAYYVAVVAYASSYPNALPSIQQDALTRSRNLQAQVVNNVCGTTVEATTLYDPGLISSVNSTFQTYSHRQPTIYEFFDAVNAGNLVSDNANWQGLLVAKAVIAASFTPPTVTIGSSSDDTKGYVYPSPAISGDTYVWGVNGGTATSIPLHPGTYNHTVRATGYVSVAAPGYINQPSTPPGLRTLATFDVAFFVEGINGPCQGANCKPF